MQSLQSLFSRRQTAQTAVSVKQPVVLSADMLKLVGGGLPRVGRAVTIDGGGVEAALPRVG